MSEPYWEPLAAAPYAVSYGTTLPASPVDGQEAILVDSLIAPVYAWRFRYTASITDAYKWVFIGGSEVCVLTDGPNSVTSSWPTMTAVPGGPAFSVPRAGFYVVTLEVGNASNSTAGAGVIAGPGTGTTPLSNVILAYAVSSTSGQQLQLSAKGMTPTPLASGAVVQLVGCQISGGTATFDRRALLLYPVRVA